MPRSTIALVACGKTSLPMFVNVSSRFSPDWMTLSSAVVMPSSDWARSRTCLAVTPAAEPVDLMTPSVAFVTRSNSSRDRIPAYTWVAMTPAAMAPRRAMFWPAVCTPREAMPPIRPMLVSSFPSDPVALWMPFVNPLSWSSSDARRRAVSAAPIRRDLPQLRHLAILPGLLRPACYADLALGEEEESPAGNCVIVPVAPVGEVVVEDRFDGLGGFVDEPLLRNIEPSVGVGGESFDALATKGSSTNSA